MATRYSIYVFDKASGQFVEASAAQNTQDTSYNDFQDKPITNLNGESQNTPVDISTLSNGLYNVSGYYRLSAESSIEFVEDNHIIFEIMTDIATDKKVAKYETIENGKTLVHTVTYNSLTGEIETNNSFKIGAAYWEYENPNTTEVKFLIMPSNIYEELENKSSHIFYYLSDTNDLYIGEQLLTSSSDIVSALSRIAVLESDTTELQRVITKLESDDTVTDSIANKIKLALNTFKNTAFSNVAFSGVADDISISDTNNHFDAANVEDALNEIMNEITNIKIDNEIYLKHTSGSLLYEIFQGGYDVSHKIGEINIPSDMVATSGSLYIATSEDEQLIDGDPYIKMTISNGQPFYIPVKELVDIYVGQNTQMGIQINVENNIISATIKTLDGSKLDSKSVRFEALEQSVQNAINNANNAIHEISEGEGNGTINVDGTDVHVHGLGSAAFTNSEAYDASGTANAIKAQIIGSVSDSDTSKTIEGVLKKINTVIESLDSTATVANKNGNTVTIKSGIFQNNGIIDNTGNADIVLSDVASTGAANDITIRDDGNYIAATNLENALQEIMSALNNIADLLQWKDVRS